jgi:hypothetical protein
MLQKPKSITWRKRRKRNQGNTNKRQVPSNKNPWKDRSRNGSVTRTTHACSSSDYVQRAKHASLGTTSYTSSAATSSYIFQLQVDIAPSLLFRNLRTSAYPRFLPTKKAMTMSAETPEWQPPGYSRVCLMLVFPDRKTVEAGKLYEVCAARTARI